MNQVDGPVRDDLYVVALICATVLVDCRSAVIVVAEAVSSLVVKHHVAESTTQRRKSLDL